MIVKNPYVRQMALMVALAVSGTVAVTLFGADNVQSAPWFMIAAIGLLCFGLYSAVAQIDRSEALRHWRVVVVAITFGVVVKYALIAGAMLATTQDWRYAVLAMAVAQIDPLGVAALENDDRMSERTKTVLGMWAAFDDPVTACVTPMILALAAGKIGSSTAAGDGWQEVAVDLIPFVAALVLVGGLTLHSRLRPNRHAKLQAASRRSASQSGMFGAGILGSIFGRLPSLAALLGWFVRPKWLNVRRLTLLTRLALFGATFLFGMVLADGINLQEGALLGVFTYLTQAIVAWLVVPVASRLLRKKDRKAHRFEPREVWHLALAQMSGITAIVIALNLEVFIDGAVATIAMVIIVVNILHFLANGLFDRLENRFWPASA